MGLTWLHLSDLHYALKDWYDISTIFQALQKDLRTLAEKSVLKPDLLFFTGDLANWGQTDEFEQAQAQFLAPLLRDLELKEDHVFFVPGNHDIERGRQVKEMRSVLANLKNDSEVENFFRGEDLPRAAFKPLDAYSHFTRTYYQLEISSVRPYYSRVIEHREQDGSIKKVAVVGLTSSWCSGYEKDQNGEVNDAQKLIVGRHLVDEAMKAAQEQAPDLIIALIHHPLHWLKEFDAEQVEQVLGRLGCHVLLHGHIHDSKVTNVSDSDQSLRRIGAGCLFAGSPRGSWPLRYNLTQLDWKTGVATVYLRRYSEKDFWSADSLAYQNTPDGQITFRLIDPSASRQPPPPPATVTTCEDWLSSKGFTENPFAWANANYMPEARHKQLLFDKDNSLGWLKQSDGPRIFIAGRGCGKTAYRHLLAGNYWPSNLESKTIAIDYAHESFSNILEACSHPSKVGSRHIAAQLIVQTFNTVAYGEASLPPAKARRLQRVRTQHQKLFNLSHNILSGFGEGDQPRQTREYHSEKTLLKQLGNFMRDCAFDSCTVIFDGFDDVYELQDMYDPHFDVLRSILSLSTSIPDYPYHFKLFVPKECADLLGFERIRDKYKTRALSWSVAELQSLLGQRLTVLQTPPGATRRQPVATIAELCEHELQNLDQEIAALADGRPRWALELADLLIQEHCQTQPVAARILPATWEAVKEKWLSQREVLRGRELQISLRYSQDVRPSQAQPESSTPQSVAKLSLPASPTLLRVEAFNKRDDEGDVFIGAVRVPKLGKQEFRLLKFLYEHQGRLQSLSEMAVYLYPDELVSPEKYPDYRAIQTLIKRINDKLLKAAGSALSAREKYIINEKARGYVLRVDPKLHEVA